MLIINSFHVVAFEFIRTTDICTLTGGGRKLRIMRAFIAALSSSSSSQASVSAMLSIDILW